MQAVYNIAEICARHGITDVVLSPGSRSAPLTLAFARHPAFRGRVRVVPDERAAAFIGLGIAQATRRPVVLVCTSGTAGLNYAPAVAEAFFQQIPLLILTADRPPEWIDQLDGQTIRQRNLYGAHAKGAFDFPADTSHPDAKWHSERIINEAINLTRAAPAGPVQVNVPLREPFYPKAGEEMGYEEVRLIERTPLHNETWKGVSTRLRKIITESDRTLLVLGQQTYDAVIIEALLTFVETKHTTIVADCISQVNAFEPITKHDIFLSHVASKTLQPDVLITFGLSLISKSLKQFLRRNPPKHHIHITQAGLAPDTFQALTDIVYAHPADFFRSILHGYVASEVQTKSEFSLQWTAADATATLALNKFLQAKQETFTEFAAMAAVMPHVSNSSSTALHLANSMAVRYANIIGVESDVEVFANRGASGIDGCTSTAVGAALAQPERPVVLLTGDVAFFYDRNAFWHNYPTPNLRVVLFNNHGGGIFRLIDGPRQQPELEEFFETRQTLTAENTARDFGLQYFPVSSFDELDTALPVFFAAETGAAILEVFTDSKTNAAFFEEYRAAVRKAFS